MKRIRTILLALLGSLTLTAATPDDASLRRQAEAMAAEAAGLLKLDRSQTATLCELLLEKLAQTRQQTRGARTPAERSQIVKRIHREFTRKLYEAYDKKTGNEIEGWYYNHTHKH